MPLARTFGLSFTRVQFTADLMPSDLTGVSIYERGKESFVFHPARCSPGAAGRRDQPCQPQTQSALLEAMEEKQVIGGGRHAPCPSPSSSPRRTRTTSWAPCPAREPAGPLSMRISLGYPIAPASASCWPAATAATCPTALPATAVRGRAGRLQHQVLAVHAAAPLLNYVQDLIAATRSGAGSCRACRRAPALR